MENKGGQHIRATYEALDKSKPSLSEKIKYVEYINRKETELKSLELTRTKLIIGL